MTTRNLTYNINARVSADGLKGYIGELQKAEKFSENQTEEIQKALKETRKLAEEQSRLNKLINAGTEGRFKNTRDLKRALSEGTGKSGVKNAVVQGQKADMRAKADNQFADLTNTVVRNMRNFTKAVGDSIVKDLAKQRQRVEKNDTLKDVDQRIKAQEFRASQAAFGVSPQSGNRIAGAAKETSLQAEQKALEELRATREQMVETQKEQEKYSRREASLQERITKAVRDAETAEKGGRKRDAASARIKKQELEVEQAALRAEGKQTDELTQQQRKLAQMKGEYDELVQAQKEQTSELQKQQKFQEQMARTASRQGTAERAGMDIKAQDQVIAGYRKMIDEELRRTGGERNQKVENFEERLAKELKLREQISQEQKEQRAEQRKQESLQKRISDATEQERQATAAGTNKEKISAQIKRKLLEIEQARLRTNGRITKEIEEQYRELARLKSAQKDARIKDDRRYTQDRLFGDKGAFLFGIQAQLAANFAIMNSLFNLMRFGVRFVLELDQAFKQLQAITATTNTEMASLEKNLIQVSEKTKFTAVEIAQAATTLGQAGFSTTQIEEAIESVSLLATATGTDLNAAVDLVTSTISVFNLQAREAANVADTFTAAVNNSKLTIDKLTLGVQYAGNIASQTGVKYEELTAAIGAMANSGIRSGSMLGTGLRRLLISFQTPTDKIIDRLHTLGLTIQDVNIQVHGLSGVMRNLQDAGFGVSDAMDTMEIRAGSAFAALSNNIESVDELRQIFTLSEAAAEANSRQMEGLSNKLARLKSIFGAFIAQSGRPFIEMIKDVIDGLSSFIQYIQGAGRALGIAGASMATFLALAASARIVAMASNFLRLGDAIRGVTGAVAGLTAGTYTLRGALVALMSTTGIGLLVALVGSVAAGMFTWSRGNREAGDTLDQLQAKVDKTEGALEKKRETVKAINDEINRLINREETLNGSQTALTTTALELEKRFGELGAVFDSNSGKVSDFIDELERLRGEMRQLQEADLNALMNRTKVTALQQFRQASDMTTPGTNREFLKGLYEQLPEGLREQARQQIRNQFGPGVEDGQRSARLATGVTAGFGAAGGEAAANTVSAALDRLASGKSAQGNDIATGLTAEDARATSTQIMQRMAEISKLQSQIAAREGRFAELSDEMANELQGVAEAVYTQLNSMRGKLQGATADLTKEQRAAFKLRVNQFQQSDAYTGQENDVTTLRGDLAEKRRNRREADTPEEQSALQDEIRVMQDRIEQIQRNMINAAMEKFDIAEREAERIVANTGAFENSNKLIGETKAFYNSVGKIRAETIKRQGDALLERLDQERSKLKDEVGGDKNIAEIEALERQIRANLQKRREVILKQALQELRDEGDLDKRGSIDAVYDRVMSGDTKTGFTQTGQMILRNTLEGTAVEIDKTMTSTFRDVDKMIDEAAKPVADNLKRFASRISDIMSQLQRDKEENRRPIEQLERKRSLMDDPRFANQYSDVDRQAMDDEVRNAESGVLRRDLEDYEIRLAELRAEAEEIERRAEARQFEIAEDKTLKNDKSASLDDREEAKARIEDNNKQVERLIGRGGELAKAQNKVRQIENQMVSTRADLAAKTGDLTAKQLTLTETVRNGFEQWRREAGVTQSVTTMIGNNIKDVFGTASKSFGTFMKDVVSGNKSIAESFKSMASTVIESLLDIVSQQLAMRMFSGMVGMFGLGGGGSVGGTGVANMVPMKQFAHGGSIKRAAGGAASTRDNQMILARDGEFVLRKSAVDAIGRENLEAINAMGNRAVSQSPGRPAPAEGNDSSGGTVNVWVVSPEEKPQMGPNDVVATIGQDIVRGGSTKKLIKQVQVGKL